MNLDEIIQQTFGHLDYSISILVDGNTYSGVLRVRDKGNLSSVSIISEDELGARVQILEDLVSKIPSW